MKELFIPFQYSVMRDVHLYGSSVASAAATFFKNMVLIYAWLPFLALLVLDQFTHWQVYGTLTVYLFAFILLYEAGYITADTIGARFEDKKIRRLLYRNVPFWASIVGICTRLLLTAGLLALLSAPISVLIAYTTTFALFLCHAFFKEMYRIATFLSLRMLKGFTPYAFLFYELSFEYKSLVFVGLISTAFYYSIEYYTKKLGGKITFDVFSVKNSFIKVFIAGFLSLVLTIMLQIPFQKTALFLIIFFVHHVLYTSLRLMQNKDQKDHFNVVEK